MPLFHGTDETSAVLEVDFDKNVTHLYESISESDWDVAMSDVHSKPEDAKTWVVRHHDDGKVMWRFLPIHSACARQPPENIINMLIGAYRDGVRCRDDQGMLPLHYACGNQASTEIIRLLLLAYPDGASIADPNGMLPLHYITQWGPSTMDAIDVLLFANRNALEVQDTEGNTPMDLVRDGEYDESQREQVIRSLQRFILPSSASDSSSHMSSSYGVKVHPVMITNKEKREISPTQSVAESKQINLRDLTSMPKTSDAVRRLQEAAAAQQRTRENYLKGSDSFMEERDDEPSMGSIRPKSTFTSKESPYMRSPMRSTLSGRSFLSTEDTRTTYTIDTSSQRMVSSLTAEVEKLREESTLAESEALKEINRERIQMQKAIDEAKEKLKNCLKETAESLTELNAKEEFGKYAESRLEEKESELTLVMKRNEELRNDLETMKRNVAKHKEKTTKLDDHLKALAKSVRSMMEEQEQIMNASSKHEEHMKQVSIARQQKMQELIDQEVAFARISLDRQKQSDLGSEEMINAALESQKNLMASVAGVLSSKVPIEG